MCFMTLVLCGSQQDANLVKNLFSVSSAIQKSAPPAIAAIAPYLTNVARCVSGVTGRRDGVTTIIVVVTSRPALAYASHRDKRDKCHGRHGCHACHGWVAIQKLSSHLPTRPAAIRIEAARLKVSAASRPLSRRVDEPVFFAGG
jgi:hypothetical protein